MAIKFEDDKGSAKEKPVKKEVGGKTYVAEEPAPVQPAPIAELPFAKPTRPEKRGRKPLR